MSIDLNFVELTADVLEFFFHKIPDRMGYWANNRSAIMRIDTYRGAQ